MKTYRLLFTAMAFTGGCLMMNACTKKTTPPPTPVVTEVTVSNLPADTIIGIPVGAAPFGANKFTFFSIENNAIIPNSDSATTKWDLGFKGSLIITNSGNTGPAGAGAFVWNGIFENLKDIPADSTFRTDNAPAAYAIPFGSGKGWYTYNPPTNLLTPIPGRILVIRTASGKYAKVEILNYYKGGVTPAVTATDEVKIKTQRYYTFRYAYQPNGSKKF
jgi:HmuY protein